MDKTIDDFKIDGLVMRYSTFAPRLYNFCLELGFERGLILPSRAFCSDESQGYPTIMLTKHFGTFPFNHGWVGGVIDHKRHEAFAHHGENLVLVHASHVGFEPDSGDFGIYRRMHTHDHGHSSTCGKISAVLDWYRTRYETACSVIKIGRVRGKPSLTLADRYLDDNRKEGLFLKLDQLIDGGKRNRDHPVAIMDGAKTFYAAPSLVERIGPDGFSEEPVPIGRRLVADDFDFHRHTDLSSLDWDTLEHNLKDVMPRIITARWPALEAARRNSQMEFDRACRTIRTEPAYRAKNLLFISGLHIDISPNAALPFPLTKFVPWGGYLRMSNGEERKFDQHEIYKNLYRQSTDNPDQMKLDQEITAMLEAENIQLPPLG